MKIKKNIIIPQKTKTNPFLLILFFIKIVTINYFKPFINIFIIAACAVLSITMPYFVRESTHWILVFRKLLITLLLIPLFIALEEYFHAAICIKKNKSECVKGVVIDFFVINNYCMLVNSFKVHCHGDFHYKDFIHIYGGGPINALIVLVVPMQIFRCFNNYNNIIILPFVLFFLSFIPLKIFDNDGYYVFHYSKKLCFSFFEVFRELLHGSYLGFKYCFTGREK